MAQGKGSVRPPIVHTYKRRGRKVNGKTANDERMMERDCASGAHAQE